MYRTLPKTYSRQYTKFQIKVLTLYCEISRYESNVYDFIFEGGLNITNTVGFAPNL